MSGTRDVKDVARNSNLTSLTVGIIFDISQLNIEGSFQSVLVEERKFNSRFKFKIGKFGLWLQGHISNIKENKIFVI